MRDLHTLFWIAKYVYRVRETGELVERGVFDAQEYRTFRRCADFLWSVRCNLHFVSGRAEERLSFDMQREIAVRLGYTSHPGMQDVERFMKHYFLIAKDVGDLTAILCAKLEDEQAKPAPVLSRMVARLRPSANRRRVPESDDFIIDNNRINLAAPDVFKHDPVNLIRIFRLAQKNNLAFHPDAMRTVTRSLKLINTPLRENPDANRLFMEILTSDNAEIVLRRMNETGVLGHFIRAFGKIVSMMQFNMYHHYTVDEHLIRCIGHLQEIERGGNDEFIVASDLFRKIQPEHRAVIYITTLLHDVAKGRPEDHSIAGARVARRLCPRLGFNAADTELVAWLIEEHLTMSTVAQSRDLSDRKTIENFAAVVQSVEQMKLLTILTTADIRGVGPGVWNGWKAQLLRTLYYETEPVLTGGFSEVNRAQRIAVAQREFRAAFTEWPEAELNAYIARHYPAYWLKVELPRKIRHARFLRASEQAGHKLAINVGFDEARGVTELTILATDHPVAAVDHRGRLRVRGRQHRRRPDLHHHRRPRARHHRDLEGIRPRRGRGPPRHPHRRNDRTGARRQAAAARSGGAQVRHPRQDARLRGRAGGHHQQPVVGPLHRDRGFRPRPPRPAVSAHDRDLEAQPQHCLRPCRDLRRTRPRRVLRHRFAGRADQRADAAGCDQELADPSALQRRQRRAAGGVIQRHCERSEAIHSFLMLRDGLLRFARNDGSLVGWVERSDTHRCDRVSMGIAALAPILRQTYVRDLAAHCARGLHLRWPPRKQRAQGRPGARCTRGLVCNCAQKTRTRAYRFSGNIPAFPAQWLYGLLRALPGERLFCHRHPAEACFSSNLTPAPRRQDHTTSPYASCALVFCAIRVHRIPPHVRDDREPPLIG